MDRTIAIGDFPSTSIFSEDVNFHYTIELLKQDKGVYTYKFSGEAPQKSTPQAVTIRWRLPA